MGKLTEFDPQIGEKSQGADAAFNFVCPLCRKGRIIVWLVLGDQARDGAHASNVLPPAWDRMTISPSIAAEGLCSAKNRGCPGWHGHIINGEVTP